MSESLEEEVLREFLVESSENLSRMDQEMFALEQSPDDPSLLGSIFRTIHTVKGTCGFFGFSRLEKIAHSMEDILHAVRSGRLALDRPTADAILQGLNALKTILASIEAGAGEGAANDEDLLHTLQKIRDRTVPSEAASEASAQIEEPLPTQDAVKQDAAQHDEAQRDPVQNEIVEDQSAILPAAASAYHVAELTSAAPVPAAVLDETSHTPQFSDAPAVSRPKTAAESSIRIDVDVVDRLMNLVGELVLTRNQLLQYNLGHEELAKEDDPLNGISQKLNLITSELQTSVMKARMQPVSTITNTLPRVVRNLAGELAKRVSFHIDGAETELDRTVLEAIKEPLVHLIRNSCDHGIELPEVRLQHGKPAEGTITMRACHEGGNVVIEIVDDGAGIDTNRIREKAVERGLISTEQAAHLSERNAVALMFLPGFSTARQITNISGRGVGLDVVKISIERVGGTIDLTSRPGKGTAVRVTIPLTLAIIPGLVVWTGGECFILPQVHVHELIWLDADAAQRSIEHVHTTRVYRQRDKLLPLAELSDLLRIKAVRPSGEISIAVLQVEGQRFGLIVDSVGDSEEIVVKPLGPLFQGLNCYSGATIMGDGTLAMILDVNGLGARSGIFTSSAHAALPAVEEDARDSAGDNSASLLIVSAKGSERIALPLSSVARLEQLPRSSVEFAGGRPVVQYRDEILPLVSLNELLGGESSGDAELLDVVVCRHGGQQIGLVVDEVVDTIEESVRIVQAAEGRDYLLGSAVIGGRITGILDLQATAAYVVPTAAAASVTRLHAALGAGVMSASEAEVTVQ